MRKQSAVLLMLLTGWGLGWVSHSYWTKEPEPQAEKIVAIRAVPKNVADITEPFPGSALSKPGKKSEPVVSLQQLLEVGDFQAAVEKYEALRASAHDSAAFTARSQILAYAQTLFVQKNYPAAAQLLKLYLAATYRDVQAHQLLADVFHADGDFRAAIDQLYEAKGLAHLSDDLNRLSRRIRVTVAEQVNAFQSNSNQTALLELYQHLTQLEPSYAPYFFGLAEAQIRLNDHQGARRSLQLILQDPEVGAHARAMLAELRVAEAGSLETDLAATVAELKGVPLLRSGNHFLVDARLSNASDVRLLIDTGASMTIVSPDVLESSGVHYTDTGETRLFNTANGRIKAPIYRIDVMSIGDWQVSQLEVGVMEFEGASSMEGLLGMNFLRHFQFFIDQNEALLRLSINQ